MSTLREYSPNDCFTLYQFLLDSATTKQEKHKALKQLHPINAVTFYMWLRTRYDNQVVTYVKAMYN